jgi:hypothetical protein
MQVYHFMKLVDDGEEMKRQEGIWKTLEADGGRRVESVKGDREQER